MKRSFEFLGEDDCGQNSKVVLVEREPQPMGIALVNPVAMAKKTFTEAMELEEGLENADLSVWSNGRNRLDIIGRQMKNLQEMMTDVLKETKEHHELHNAACNFVKRPGHIYHLYQRPSGQKYFSMLSPQEWTDAPHNYLGSWKLEADQSWTAADQVQSRFDGLEFIRNTLLAQRSVTGEVKWPIM